ncbi:MAG TPA: succinate dehydrogenase [Patescibacteria group bacterium]|nr:succinate dehydrogenase [Patescibacteria group bacterium]
MDQRTSATAEIPIEASVVSAAVPDRSYFWDKLHSLTGIVPIGAFLVEHFWSNSYALVSVNLYNKTSYDLQTIPWRVPVEALFIWIPILYHGFYGIYIWSKGKSNAGRYAYGANWMYVLQRWTGLVAFVFIGWHVYIERFMTQGRSTYMDVAATLSNPLYLSFYIVGILAASFHFGNGLWQFSNKWGLVVGRKAQRKAAWVAGTIGVLFAVVGLLIIFGFVFQWQPFHFYAQ